MIEAVIFDCGRVFLHDPDTEVMIEDIARSCKLGYETAAEAVGRLLPSFQTGMTEEDFWQKFKEDTKVALPPDYEQLWVRSYVPHTSIDYAVLGYVAELQPRFKTPLLSNHLPPHARVNRQRGLFQLFEPVILSCEVGYKKPEPEIYLLAAVRTGVKPEECVFVDDVQEYVEAARKVGMQAVQYQNLPQLEKDLREYGVNSEKRPIILLV